MQSLSNISEQIHMKAIEIAGRYRRCESELVEILQQVEQHRVFLEKGCSSLFEYAVRELKLSSSVAYNFITVSRKARVVPELKEKLKTGAINLTNARRIAAVMTPANQAFWIQKAGELSEKQLEKEIAKVKPEILTPERAKYVTGSRVKLEVGLKESDMLALRRVQDLVSQSQQNAATLEDVIVKMTQEYFKKHDPIQKAKRHVVRNAPAITTSKPTDLNSSLVARRVPTLAAVLHQVNLRDQRKCTIDGCTQTRWLEIHHKIPVSQGGQNTVENLTTLCSIHHDWIHRK